MEGKRLVRGFKSDVYARERAFENLVMFSVMSASGPNEHGPSDSEGR